VFNTAVRLDGVNDTVRVPDSASLDVGDSFSLEGWVKRTNAGKNVTMFNKGGQGFQLAILNGANGSAEDNRVVFRKANGTTIARSTATVPADANFHHIVATKSGTNSARIYIDGAEAGTVQVTPSAVVQNTTFPLLFGMGNMPQVVFDEFAVWGRALSAAEVAQHYTGGGQGPID
jgi:hypothetical protein